MEKRTRIYVWISLISSLLLMAFAAHAVKNEFIYRIAYSQYAIGQNTKHANAVVEHVGIAGRSGYNALVSCDVALENLEKQPQRVFDDYNRVFAAAKAANIKVFPWHFYQAQPARDLQHLSETFPVKGTKFVVTGKEARAVGDHVIGLKNGGFESFTGGKPANWSLSYLPGTHCVMDKSNRKQGAASLRVKNAPPHSRIKQTINVKPFRAYQISAWFKTSGIKRYQKVQFSVDPHLLHRRDIPTRTPNRWSYISPTMNWTKVVFDFNSLKNTQVTLGLCFAWKVDQVGDIWVDDIRVREVGLYETIKIRSKPVTVRSADGKTTYEEGKDFVVDPISAEFTDDSYNHEGHLKIPAGSSIRNGQELRVDWYQFSNIETMHSEADFCLPETWDALKDNLTRIDKLFGHSDAMWCNVDEWRVGGWNENCETFKFTTAGEYIAKSWQGMECLMRSQGNGCRTIISWSDMFDGWHNSWHTYGTMKGGTWRAWEGLGPDVIITNWNGKYAKESIRFFAGIDTTQHLDPRTGKRFRKTSKNRQLLNVLDPGNVYKWISVLEEAEKEGIEGVVGLSWVTWSGDYTQMPKVAAACKARGRWPTNPFPTKTCDPVKSCDSIISVKDAPRPSQAAQSLQLGTKSASNHAIDVQFSVPEYKHMTLKVFDLLGREIQILVKGKREIGAHNVTWNTSVLPAGVYFLRLAIDGVGQQTLKQIVF